MSRLLVPVLVLVCAVCACVCAVQQRDYGVKLCGREFIRAVIFTCGGSRWRRTIGLELPAQDPVLLSYQSLSDRDEHPIWLKSDAAAAASEKQSSVLSSSSFFLSNLLQAMRAEENTRDESNPSEETKRSWLDSLFSGPPGSERVRSLDLGWLHEDRRRRRRNYSLGLAGICCSQGCTKNDIGRLC